MSAPEKTFQKAAGALNQRHFTEAQRLFKKGLAKHPWSR
jgi:hypothetical protein